MTPAKYDFGVWRGTAGPTQGLKVQLKAKQGDALVNIPYEDVRLSIFNRKELLMRLSLANARLEETDAGNAEITWSPTTMETRLIPLGAKATYELEVWNGVYETVYLYGTITGQGGINDDQADAELS